MYAYTQHPRGADRSAAQTGRGTAHRRLDAREHGRVDGLSALLRVRRRGAAAARRRGARDDLSVRPVPGRRRQDRDARAAERARVGRCSASRCCSSPSSRPTSASPPTRGAAPRATSCARSSSRPSRRSPPSRWSRGSTPRRSPTRASTTCTRCGRTRSCRRASAGREVDTPAGPVPALLPPGARERIAPRMDAVPALGEHTDAILRRARLRRDDDRAPARAKARSEDPSRRRTRHPERRAGALRRRAALRRHPRAGAAPRRGPAARLARLGAGRQGRAAGREHRPLRSRRWGRPTGRARC